MCVANASRMARDQTVEPAPTASFSGTVSPHPPGPSLAATTSDVGSKAATFIVSFANTL